MVASHNDIPHTIAIDVFNDDGTNVALIVEILIHGCVNYSAKRKNSLAIV